MFNNSSILITGGTGSFGHSFASLTLKKYNPDRLVIFSRDEMKQWEMAKLFQDDPRIRFFIGDVRDKDRLHRALHNIDFVVHAIAYSDKEELKGEYMDTSRENFNTTMDISVYSFTAIAKRAAAMMPNGGSMITLTYYGAERVMPHYNVMGVAKAALESSVRYLAADLGSDKIRVNSLSAGPIKTLAASGIGDFRYILKWNQYNSPLRRNVTLKDVGGSGVYLLSDLSAGVTGETHHVDCGYHVVGMKAIDAPDMSPEKKDK